MFNSIKLYIMIGIVAFAFGAGWQTKSWQVGALIAKAQAKEIAIMAAAQKLHIAWESSRQVVRVEREVVTVERIREVRINVPVNPQCDLVGTPVRLLRGALTDSVSTTPTDITP